MYQNAGTNYKRPSTEAKYGVLGNFPASCKTPAGALLLIQERLFRNDPSAFVAFAEKAQLGLRSPYVRCDTLGTENGHVDGFADDVQIIMVKNLKGSWSCKKKGAAFFRAISFLAISQIVLFLALFRIVRYSTLIAVVKQVKGIQIGFSLSQILQLCRQCYFLLLSLDQF